MVKKLFKRCLMVSMACALSSSAMAADVNVNFEGRVRSWLESVAVKDSTSTTQMKADSRIGASVSTEAGSWKVSVFQNMDMSTAGNVTAPAIRDQKITLENDSMAITAGRFSPYGVTKGMAYTAGDTGDNGSFWVGENLLTTDRTNHVTVALKDIGLTAILGINNYNTSAVGDARNETVLGAVYGLTMGAIDLGAEVITASSAIDEKDADAVKGGAYDGQSFLATAIGVGYTINEKMGAAFNFETNSKTDGTAGATAATNTILEFWFDMGLDDTSGISVGYGSKSLDDGSANKTAYSLMSLSYKKTMGIADVYATYLSSTEKDDDAPSVDTATTTITVGMTASF